MLELFSSKCFNVVVLPEPRNPANSIVGICFFFLVDCSSSSSENLVSSSDTMDGVVRRLVACNLVDVADVNVRDAEDNDVVDGLRRSSLLVL